jgi:hypothetical protein
MYAMPLTTSTSAGVRSRAHNSLRYSFEINNRFRLNLTSEVWCYFDAYARQSTENKNNLTDIRVTFVTKHVHILLLFLDTIKIL